MYLFNYLERESQKAPFTFTFHLWEGVRGGVWTPLNARSKRTGAHCLQFCKSPHGYRVPARQKTGRNIGVFDLFSVRIRGEMGMSRGYVLCPQPSPKRPAQDYVKNGAAARASAAAASPATR